MVKTDFVISGAGPVGLMLAIGLSQKGFKVVLVERFKPAKNLKKVQNSFDGRVLALSHGSRLALEKLDLWHSLSDSVTDIKHVHVSQKGYLGITKLHAEEASVPALGYSIQSSELGQVLWKKAKQQSHITLMRPAILQTFTQDEQGVLVDIKVDGQLTQVAAKMIIGADGTDSQVRKVLKLPIQEKSYQAYGVIAQIETELDPQGWSYERFTEEGPVALLPMHGRFHKAVLVCSDTQIEEVKALDDHAFIELFAQKMGERFGRYVSVSSRMAYSLKETYVPQMLSGRAILMGNASHTQHPVAAQGLNLGIRDIDEFLTGLVDSKALDNQTFLHQYAQSRRVDHEKVMGLTDNLIHIFQHTSPVVGHLRGLGLMAMQALPSLRKRFTAFAMGGKRA